MTTPASQVLREALALLGENGEGLVHDEGTIAETADGESVLAHDDRACRFCLLGATWRAAGRGNFVVATKAQRFLRDALNQIPDSDEWASTFTGTTRILRKDFAPSRAAFLRAIALAEGEEAK